MARKRYTEEQIIGVLKEAEVGANTSELCRKHGMSEATFYKWKAKHAGLTLNELDGGGQCLEAERVGFEPTRGLLPYAISSRACSATPAPLRWRAFYAALSPWRRGWDLNPRPGATGNRFSRAAP